MKPFLETQRLKLELSADVVPHIQRSIDPIAQLCIVVDGEVHAIGLTLYAMSYTTHRPGAPVLVEFSLAQRGTR